MAYEKDDYLADFILARLPLLPPHHRHQPHSPSVEMYHTIKPISYFHILLHINVAIDVSIDDIIGACYSIANAHNATCLVKT